MKMLQNSWFLRLSLALAGIHSIAQAAPHKADAPSAMDITTTNTILPRQAAPVAPPPPLNVREELGPKQGITYQGDVFAVPRDGNFYVILKDGKQALIQPSTIVVNGQSVAFPPAPTATTIRAGGLDFAVGPITYSPPKHNTEDTLKGLTGLAYTLQALLEGFQPLLDPFIEGKISSKDLANNHDFAPRLDAILRNYELFNDQLRGLPSSPPLEQRDGSISDLMANFPPAEGTQAVEAYSNADSVISKLRSLRNLVGVAVSLTADEIAALEASWRGAAAVVAGSTAIGAMGVFAAINWVAAANNAKLKTPPAPPETMTNGTIDVKILYLFGSRYNTSRDDFDGYCKKLDNLRGFLISRPGNPFQGYQKRLNQSQVEDVKKQPWYQFIEPVPVRPTPLPDYGDTSPGPGQPNRRSMSQNLNLNTSNTSGILSRRRILDEERIFGTDPNNIPTHRRLLSASKDTNQYGPAKDQRFLYDNNGGQGVTMYIVDLGFDLGMNDLQTGPFPPPGQDPGAGPGQRRVDHFFVPNEASLTESVQFGYDPDWTSTVPSIQGIGPYGGHGTFVATTAAGLLSGVASKADLYLLKATGIMMKKNYPFEHAGATLPTAIFDIYSVIMEHVISNGRQKKAVINMSVDFDIDGGLAMDEDSALFNIFNYLRDFCRENGVVWTVAAGNDGTKPEGYVLGEVLPQRIGTATNEIITVGGVNDDGWLWYGTRAAGASRRPIGKDDVSKYPGFIDIYAPALDVNINLGAHGGPAQWQKFGGTSYSAPLAAGLAAYFINKPPTGTQFTMDIAREMKGILRQQAVHWPDPPFTQFDVITINNSARSSDHALCRRDEGAQCHGEVPNGPKPITPAPPPPAAPTRPTGRCGSGLVEFATFSDGECNDFVETICVDGNDCKGTNTPFHSMKLLQKLPIRWPYAATITSYSTGNCKNSTPDNDGAHGFGGDNMGCLKQFNKGKNNDLAPFDAHSIGITLPIGGPSDMF